MEKRLERQARNEALVREVNEKIAAADERATSWAVPQERFLFHCECGRTTCDGRVLMTLAEYGRARSQRDRFAVLPGHESAEIESVVEQDERYVIVDKQDAVEHLVDS